MAQLIDKDALVAEIERRRKNWSYGSSIEAKYKREECNDILSIIDSLQEEPIEYNPFDDFRHTDSEEPVSDDLEEEIERYFKDWYFDYELDVAVKPNHHSVSFDDIKDIARHFAEWGKKQAAVEIQAQSMAVAHGCCKEAHIDDDLEEAAFKAVDKLCKQVHKSTMKVHTEAVIMSYGAGLYKAGANWQREQLMKDAITACCFNFHNSEAVFSFKQPAENYLVGSELKVVIVKED